MTIAALIGYIGPGPGLSMLGALLGLAATLAVAFWAVALWPYRVLARKWRESREEAAEPTRRNGG